MQASGETAGAHFIRTMVFLSQKPRRATYSQILNRGNLSK